MTSFNFSQADQLRQLLEVTQKFVGVPFIRIIKGSVSAGSRYPGNYSVPNGALDRNESGMTIKFFCIFGDWRTALLSTRKLLERLHVQQSVKLGPTRPVDMPYLQSFTGLSDKRRVNTLYGLNPVNNNRANNNVQQSRQKCEDLSNTSLLEFSTISIGCMFMIPLYE